jgi:hypothetical protein
MSSSNHRPQALPLSPETQQGVKVMVVTSVMLSFISFWRAAAIVLSDLASTAYYIGGITERAIGEAAPYFILSVMIFAYAVRLVYIESCSMFTRGGVYRVVRSALGENFAKVAVSALMFDYILTGSISSVSAGQYLVGLFKQSFGRVSSWFLPSRQSFRADYCDLHRAIFLARQYQRHE